LKDGETAGPIKGINGVYVVQVIHRTEAVSLPISSFRSQLTGTARAGIDTRLMEAVKSTAKIKDNRYNFY
jgi:hypothetical protein